MKYKLYSFRHALIISNEKQFIEQFEEIFTILNSVTDEELIGKHSTYGTTIVEKTPMSLSKAINEILKQRFTEAKWHSESEIFKDNRYSGSNWRLDFAKNDVSIEVAFNHASAIAWNLLKPVLASELNHVEKAIQTKIGVVITATSNLQKVGGFDSAIGTFEKFIQYLPVLNNVLTVPLLIIGLEPPETFTLQKHQQAERKKIGNIIMKDKPISLPKSDEIQF